jgi:hypothetical protein
MHARYGRSAANEYVVMRENVAGHLQQLSDGGHQFLLLMMFYRLPAQNLDPLRKTELAGFHAVEHRMCCTNLKTADGNPGTAVETRDSQSPKSRRANQSGRKMTLRD